MSRTLWIEEASIGTNHIAMRFGVDDLPFNTTYWYEGVDLHALERAYGAGFLRSMLFHATAFEANKLLSLGPEEVDFGPYSDLVTEPFWELWTKVWRGVFGQWRYENDRPNYDPKLAHELAETTTKPVMLPSKSKPKTLAFIGGGKDSLAAMMLLDESQIDYDTYGYSHSVYGAAGFQHRLLDKLVRHGERAQRHLRHWIYDDFLDSPVRELRPDLDSKTLTAGETPSSLFGVIPVVLAGGYGTLVLGHERSADIGNLVWEETGEEVNHQWGKSMEAERLLQAYVREHLVSDLTYTSVLKPIYDSVIFAGLQERAEAVKDTHSCNVRKPWCEECPKCAYVWLNFSAFLPADVVPAMFKTNLADNPANDLWFRQMFGLADHTPFECVGQIGEARLALAMARERGLRGHAIDACCESVQQPSRAAIDELFEVPPEHHTMPPELARHVVPILERWGRLGRATALRHLGYGAVA